MFIHLGERRVTVKMLAPGNKPYFQLLQIRHRSVPLFFTAILF
jgi:hypothetical protein